MPGRARGLVVLIFVAALGCAALAAAEPNGRGSSVEATKGPRPDGDVAAPEILHVPVEGDRDLEVVLGPADSRLAAVYLHGVCGDPLAFESWAGAAARHATLISLRGDVACKTRPGRTKWSWSPRINDRRIRHAVQVASGLRRARGLPELDSEQIALIGYSQGAARVQALAIHYPKRYRRVAIIAIATEPKAEHLRRTERVLLMAGGWDARAHIHKGYLKLARLRGKRTRYLELPRARHGDYGPRALETMTEALDWLFAPPAPPSNGTGEAGLSKPAAES